MQSHGLIQAFDGFLTINVANMLALILGNTKSGLANRLHCLTCYCPQFARDSLCCLRFA